MVFSSHLFIFYFLSIVLLIYFALAKAPLRARNLLLALTGYIFYGWAEPKFIFLMFASTFIDWLVALVISYDSWHFLRDWRKPPVELTPGARSRLQKTALVISIVCNLSMLGFFKYFNFGLDSYNNLVTALGWSHLHWDTFLRVILPLGISFYTFQSMSYTIDVYRGEGKAQRNFIDFSCYVSMFPQLVAGPILKYSYVADQLTKRSLTLDKFARGVAFFALGLAKKVLIANPCGKIADVAFNAGARTLVDSWLGVTGYAFQIYFDFSGYSDMAIGLGLMFGFVFARNFATPYRSESITEFWRRWHISLSTWLREYLYVPLGGNRKGKTRTYINLALTMLLGGLWHGAAWNFVIWGGLHGGALAFERSLGKKSPYGFFPRPLRVLITFLIVSLGWVFFRAETLPGALQYLGSMFGSQQSIATAAILGGILYKPYYLLTLAMAVVATWILPDTWEITQRMSWPKTIGIMLIFVLAVAILVTQEYNPFIYFIF